MTVVATLKDGRVIAKADVAQVITAAAGKVYTTATLTDLKTVEYVLQFNLNAEANVNFSPERPSISGNIVGVTVYCGGGTTITGECIAIGF